MSSTKTAIVVLSDPQGGEEALGRLFNALAATYDFKQKHQDVQLVFQGTGTRWTGLLTKTDHPAHALYKAVEDKVAGASSGLRRRLRRPRRRRSERLLVDHDQSRARHRRAAEPRDLRRRRLLAS